MFSEVKRAVKHGILRSRDFTNLVRYGAKAPKYAERIWVNPRDIHHALVGPSTYATCSGKVIRIGEHFRLIDLYTTPRIESSFAHWVDGVPWERTKDYRVMLEAIRNGKDWAGCRTEEDLVSRYEQLDEIFETTQQSMRLKTRKEVDPGAFREEGGILVCIGENGEPLLYDGFHRLAIALILEVPIVPAQLGYVDEKSMDSLDHYRQRPLPRDAQP